MTTELGDFYQLVAYWRAYGLTESEAHAKAEEMMESQSTGKEQREN